MNWQYHPPVLFLSILRHIYPLVVPGAHQHKLTALVCRLKVGVIMEIHNVPVATTPGAPKNSYGKIRFLSLIGKARNVFGETRK